MNYELIEQLQTLYFQMGKHSQYQALPAILKKIMGVDFNVNSRYEEERLRYITSVLNIKGKVILEIGGNTGFFTVELVRLGARRLFYVEGNRTHVEFVRLVSELLKINDKIEIIDEYYDFKKEFKRSYVDIVFLLNVLHHIGDDFDRDVANIQEAKTRIIEYLNRFSRFSNYLVFQMGYCWKGNRSLLFFERGTKREMIEFLKEGVKGHWEFESVGIPVVRGGKIFYLEPDKGNMKRRDDWGEFLNRPIFILRSSRRR